MVLRWLWHSFPWTFSGGVVRVQVWWMAFADRVEGETRPRWVASGLKQPGALLVEPVDQDTPLECPM